MRTLLAIILVGTATAARAQETISAAGAHYAGTAVQLSCNIGEPVIATVSGAQTTLTQGFEQPWADVSTWAPALEDSGEQVLVYPNPTRYELFVALGRGAQGERYTLFDAAGKLVTSGLIQADIHAIGMEGIASGNYQLVLQTQEGSPLGAFRIIVNH